jgi:hypothetical protein
MCPPGISAIPSVCPKPLTSHVLSGASRPYLIQKPEVIRSVGPALKSACTAFAMRKEVLWKAMRAIGMLCVTGRCVCVCVWRGITGDRARTTGAKASGGWLKEALWSFVLPCACSDVVRTELVKHNMTEAVVKVAMDNSDLDVQQEAVWALSALAKNGACELRIGI